MARLRDRARTWLVAWVPALLPVLLFVATGLRGIDFGFHWDEALHAQGVHNSLARGIGLPGIYYYPGVSYWLSLAAAAPALVDASDPEETAAALSSASTRERTRIVFLLASSLALLFVYGLVRAWRGSTLEALLAAALLGTSWEVAYHARWIAPDGVVMAFAALTLLGLARAGPGRSGGLVLAAAAAALACGTKWTAGLVLVPVLAAGWTGAGLVGAAASEERPASRSLRHRLTRVAALAALFALVYLATTPATVLDWERLREYLALQQQRYALGHLGHTVSAGPEHLARMLEYLLLVLPSPFAPVSLLLSALMAVGLVALLRASPRAALLFLAFPVLYLAYLALHRVMIVRNLLVVAPFLAVLTARGAARLAGRIAPGWPRRAFAAGLTALVALDAGWLVHAGESIRRPPAHFAAALAAYLEERPGTRFFVSPGAGERLRQAGVAVERLPNASRDPRIPRDAVVVLASELRRSTGDGLPANRRDLVRTSIGPREVNWSYYPSWQGRDRFLVLSAERARALGRKR